MNNFKGKKVLVFGLGLNQGGVGSAQFFASKGAIVKITDLKTKKVLESSINQLKKFPGITYTLGKHKYEDIDWADLIIKNPAVKPSNPYLQYAQKHHKKIETDMGIFLQHVKPDQIIGVTGTKGKSTTASLIYEVFKKTFGVNLSHTRGGIRTHRWKNVILAGNIGVSVLETIPLIKKDILIVLEISSFQLEAFKKHRVSPRWAVITNITPDHLNYHQSMKDYINAKKIIAQYQKTEDFLFLPTDLVGRVRRTYEVNLLKGIRSKIIYFSKQNLPADFKPSLLGEHNKENIAAALAVGKIFGLNKTSILKTLSQFKGIPFRMELAKIWNGVKIYNDTAATSPEAGIQAIKTFPGCILICGGMNKGMDYTEYATAIVKNVKKVFFLEGDSTDSILLSLRGAKRRGNLKIYGPYNNLEKLLADVKEIAKPGDIILFSPAATSFNLFQNEFDRGRQFNKAVEKVFT